ncbi:uncharacterized protein LOC128217861 [Mya arenaria]|uniref:uncharacterized protein LOC128217861 n=1 Tax=Mya arenaria TaxID=6604 RepID=UPI0022E0CF29|nr:uncharacterized protein LOC128217861 [Mya arenaria]XP_052781242.1 uncharacterized protein LOC128217861 [Mya arenaria]
MGLGTETITKKRKVVYDEYTGGFYAESKVESIQRQCDYRLRLTDVMNKAEHAKYRFACKQVDAEKQLFLMRKEKATHRHNEALVDYKAHLNVLDKLAKEREEITAQMNDIYGKYPPESLRTNLEEQILIQRKEMSPIVQRRREANRLLNDRKPLEELDRTKSTGDIMNEIKNRKSRANSPVKRFAKHSPTNDGPKQVPKLMLPAITVDIGKLKSKRQADGLHRTKSTNDVSTLPSVFVTDPSSFK